MFEDKDNRLDVFKRLNSFLTSNDYKYSVNPPSFTIKEFPADFGVFEEAARTCYDSFDKIGEGSDENLYKKILKRNHTAMLEFLPSMSVMFETSRGVSHEMVRMRLCSFAQSSTRYIKYGCVPFILPWKRTAEGFVDFFDKDCTDRYYQRLAYAFFSSSESYSMRLEEGEAPEEARGSLNNDTKTNIWVKANIREWLHIFNLRCDAAAHPDFRILACGLLHVLLTLSPKIFEGLIQNKGLHTDISWFLSKYDLVSEDHKTFYILKKLDASIDR